MGKATPGRPVEQRGSICDIFSLTSANSFFYVYPTLHTSLRLESPDPRKKGREKRKGESSNHLSAPIITPPPTEQPPPPHLPTPEGKRGRSSSHLQKAPFSPLFSVDSPTTSFLRRRCPA